MRGRTALAAGGGALAVAALTLVLDAALDAPALSVLGVGAVVAAFVVRALWQGTLWTWAALLAVVAVAAVASVLAG